MSGPCVGNDLPQEHLKGRSSYSIECYRVVRQAENSVLRGNVSVSCTIGMDNELTYIRKSNKK